MFGLILFATVVQGIGIALKALLAIGGIMGFADGDFERGMCGYCAFSIIPAIIIEVALIASLVVLF